MPRHAVHKEAKSGSYFEVEIWSAKEMKRDDPFTLGCYDVDIDKVAEALNADSEFIRLISDSTNSNFVRELVAHVLCEHTRQTTRKYGVGH